MSRTSWGAPAKGWPDFQARGRFEICRAPEYGKGRFCILDCGARCEYVEPPQ